MDSGLPCFLFTERFHLQYAASTLFIYERCHSHSAVAACSCRAVALCGCLHYCACACKLAPRIMQHTRFFYERCHSHSAVATCSCRAVALCACLHYCARACKPAPRTMQHTRTARRYASVLQRIHKCRDQLFLS